MDPSTSKPSDPGSELKNIVEAALLAATEPLSLGRLGKLFTTEEETPPSPEQLRAALQQLQQEYAARGIELKEVASGFRFQVRSRYARWVNRIWDQRPPRYSRALLETLAIIAYRQPVTRGEIESIRGISVNTNIIRALTEREWIRSVGHREVPGRPELLATTRQFLDYFNLKKLGELPSLPDLRSNELPDLFENPPLAASASPGTETDRQSRELTYPDPGTDPATAAPERLEAKQETPDTHAGERETPTVISS